MKEKGEKFEKVKRWWHRNKFKIFCGGMSAVLGTLSFLMGRGLYMSGYAMGKDEQSKSDLKSLLGEYEAHDAGFIKYFDPSTGTEVSRKEALELFKKS